MTTNYHTPISTGAAANAATVNSPLSQLDTQISSQNTEIVAARGSQANIDARLDVALNENGTIKTGAITAQAQLNVGDAAAVNGDLARYQELTNQHNADGSHKSNIINTAQLVDGAVTEIKIGALAVTSGKLATGAVSGQVKVNLSDAAAQNGDAARYQEFTLEHNADGTHKEGIITPEMIADRTRHLWIPADDFQIIEGSVELGILASAGDGDGLPFWMFDPALDAKIGVAFLLPADNDGSTSITIKLHYSVSNDTTGEVRLYVGVVGVPSGSTLDTNSVSTETTDVTIPASSGKKYLIFQAESINYAASSGLFRVNIERQGTHANDDYSGGFYFIGLEVEYNADS